MNVSVRVKFNEAWIENSSKSRSIFCYYLVNNMSSYFLPYPIYEVKVLESY